jgi:aryl-alcohol dehydrogenase-like predicted oxidoreductase
VKLAVGTAQFGLSYGVSNAGGKTQPEEIRRILDIMRGNGLDVLDTAPAYGDAEAVLGIQLGGGDKPKIVTKTPPIRKQALTAEHVRYIRECFVRSLGNLGVQSVYALLVHHVEDVLVPGGEALLELLRSLKADGLVRKIGVSAYDARQIEAATDRFGTIDIVQVPVSIVDQRLIASGHLDRLSRSGTEIHARSIFLQGLLLMQPSQVPEDLGRIRELLGTLAEDAASQRTTVAHYAVQFVKSLESVHHMIVGVNDAAQLLANILAYREPLGSTPDYSRFACHDEQLLNPSTWKVH